jgi:hypothetical protein
MPRTGASTPRASYRAQRLAREDENSDFHWAAPPFSRRLGGPMSASMVDDRAAGPRFSLAPEHPIAV